MPGKIKVKVLAGRNLPVMDRASDTTDAFVEIKFGSVTHKTDVCRKSLNPHWNSTEWHRFEVDESELQDEPLQLRLMDHDTYSANDAIGKVVISLAPLLAREANNPKNAGAAPSSVLSGWIPVFDTMHGIRGELNVIVKVELFSDFNKYKTSSCGVQFFHCSSIPPGYKATAIHGFVEELVVNDDPEYQWIDKIRTPRASNEARQVAFIKLSNQVQRLVGLKAAELGANAVVGYQQDFDLEGEAGVVARAIGTAVSLIPPPTTNQSINIPPCTQQQLKKYLDILATDNESVTDLNQYFQSHRDELQKLVTIMNPKTTALLDEPDNIEDDEKSEKGLTRQSSIISYTGNLSIYQDDHVSRNSLKHISDDQTDLNKLLKRNDDSDSDSSGTLQKIKKVKTNFFVRRFGSMRSRKTDKQEDQISLQSNSSDTSRISLTDIKNEFKKLKRLKKPKFRKSFANKQDEGIGMASILARSVIHAHTSLACIAKTQDSEHSPSSTMRRTSESEPMINVSDDDNKIANTDTIQKNISLNEHKIKVPEIHTSLRNINIDNSNTSTTRRILSESCPATPMAERSGNLLKLPGETGYFGSSLSGDSSEVYTSSEEDDDSSDQNAEIEKSLETTSSVVQSVLNKGVNPNLIAQMDRKLSIREGTTPILKESKSQSLMGSSVEPILQNNLETSKSSPCFNDNDYGDKNNLKSKDITFDTNPGKGRIKSPSFKENDSPSQQSNNDHNYHFKFHNPFVHKISCKSASMPTSPVENHGFVYRSSKKIKRQLSKITNSNMIKSLSHYSLLPRKKHEVAQVALSQPGSTTDMASNMISHETVLGSPLLSYADLMSLDKEGADLLIKPQHKIEDYEQSKVAMYIGSEPVSRASVSGPSSVYYKDEGSHIDNTCKSIRKNSFFQPRKSTGLVHTAVETMLIDKVQSLLIPTSPASGLSKDKQFFEDVNEKLEKIEEARTQINLSNIERGFERSSSEENICKHSLHCKRDLPLFTRQTSNMNRDREEFFEDYPKSRDKKFVERKESHENMFQTAMKTILIDKVQALIPPSAELMLPDDSDLDDQNYASINAQENKEKTSSLLHNAMETILLEKAQVLMPPLSENCITRKKDNDDTISANKNFCESVKSGGSRSNETCLLHTAMETILMEKAQTLIPQEAEPSIPQSNNFAGDSRPNEMSSINTKDNPNYQSSLVQTANKKILIDKAQALKTPTSAPERVIAQHTLIEDISQPKIKDNVGSKSSHSSLLQTATETNLIEKSLVTPASKPLTPRDKHVRDISQTENISKMEKTQSLIPTALEHNIHAEESSKKICLTEQKEKPEKDNSRNSIFRTAMETVLIDQVKSLIPTTKFIISHDTPSQVMNKKGDSLLNSAMETILIDKVQSLIPSTSDKSERLEVINNQSQITKTTEFMKDVLFDTNEKNHSRQDSVHSLRECTEELPKMSKETGANISIPPKVTHSKPVLQHFHPILSGPPLETIPSLPESGLDLTESLDIEGVDQTSDCQSVCKCIIESGSRTNSASVCGNSHAACDVNRNDRDKEKYEKEKSSPRHARHESYGGREPVVTSQSTQNASLNSTSTPLGIHRRSSDSDLSVTPKGSSLNASAGNAGSGGGAILRPSMNSSNLDMLEYPFLTMMEYPPGFIVHLGGTVCARSVKLVDGGGESAARAAWWAELRTELRAHARALRCNAVIAYTESAAICEDVCVLSASGTAAVINLDCDFSNDFDVACAVTNGYRPDEAEPEVCSIAHVPYSPGTGPNRAELSTCGGCRRARIPAVLLATCAKPSRLHAYPKAVTVTAVAARIRRAPPAAEPGARDISDQLPFLEYELHKLLLAKLRMQGANALFGLQTQIAIGERCVMALANGTAVRLVSLPPPTPPRIKASENDKDALEIQRALWDSFTANKAANGYDLGGSADQISNGALPELEGEEVTAPTLDLSADKDTCVLELDEAEDVETAKTLAARRMHMQVFTNSLKAAYAAPPHAFAQVWRARLAQGGSGGGSAAAAERHVARALDGVTYKLRRLQPCAMVAPAFQLELPEDEIQLVVSGTAVQLVDPLKPDQLPENGYQNHTQIQLPQSQGNDSLTQGSSDAGDADDDIFALDEEQVVKTTPPAEITEDRSLVLNGQVPTSVSLTSLSFVSGSRAERRICALRLLFVRETTAVRELGGLSGFLHTFTSEVLAIVRAYTAALGGNALTSFYLTQLMLQDNAHKNQGQCLLSVGGDVVHIAY